ncbi:MAG: hypothetical protein AVDCRST_MAG64-556, partial [uncultured Phycisphaerae bacterium]
ERAKLRSAIGFPAGLGLRAGLDRHQVNLRRRVPFRRHLRPVQRRRRRDQQRAGDLHHLRPQRRVPRELPAGCRAGVPRRAERGRLAHARLRLRRSTPVARPPAVGREVPVQPSREL